MWVKKKLEQYRTWTHGQAWAFKYFCRLLMDMQVMLGFLKIFIIYSLGFFSLKKLNEKIMPGLPWWCSG